jgi:hypothetical protein
MEFKSFEYRSTPMKKEKKEKYPTMNEEIFPHSLSKIKSDNQ